MWKYVVQFIDGTTEEYGRVGGCAIPATFEKGMMNLWFKNGDMADLELVAGIPMSAMKVYTRSEA